MEKSSNSSSSSSNSSPQFLSTDRGKTESNAIEIPSISLPKGGGAIKGIDEKFSVNAVNGTASFSIPLPFSSARGASPSLSLSYNSGAGNGIFGLGWNLELSSIQRKTADGLPQYLDAIESDTFLLSEAEDLVPAFKKLDDGSFAIDADNNYVIHEKDAKDAVDRLCTIRYYRPRIEGLFARIERWTEKVSGRIKWRVTTRENATTLFGWTDQAIIADPNDPIKIYKWLPEFVFDDQGNCAQYIYKKEDDIGFDPSSIHNKNRFKEGKITYTNAYLAKVLYGNLTPYRVGDAFPHETAYMFQTLFDYGTLLPEDTPETVNDWDFRPDAFSDYRAGFEIRTTRLCKRVLLFHVFDELAQKPDRSDKKTLVKSINLDYDTATEEDFTFLKSITTHGYIKKADGAYSEKQLPPITFAYQQHEWNKDVKSIAPEELVHAPVGLDDVNYQFTDLYNEGLSGILTEQANGWYYKHNLGNGRFERAKLVAPKPSFTGLGGKLQLVDLDADGGKQLLNLRTEPKGYFELDDDNEWSGWQTLKAIPNIELGDPNTRMLDLNGDGKPEVLISEDHVFTWYESQGREGFSAARKTFQFFDEEAGPRILFSEATQTIFLADMSGDGMTDIVRIRNGEVCYWPNLGYGNFGAKVTMDHAPWFDHPEAFNPSYLRLADIDGSGTADIIYLGKNKVTCWKNLSGNQFGMTPFEITSFPEIHPQANITVVDLLGNGVSCIVWSSTLTKDAHAPLQYIDLMNSKKPHLLVKYQNNMGKEVAIEYTPSTQFYLQDKLEGKPWVTKLHFPVHCVSKIITEDKIVGSKFCSAYTYHHGYFDHPEREFRGFGMVEQRDTETFEHWVTRDATNITDATLHQEPVITRTWNHTGAFLRKDQILEQFAKDYWYEEMERQGFVALHNEKELPEAKLVVAEGLDASLIDQLSGAEWRQAFRACKGMVLRTETFAEDAIQHGNTEEARQKELTPYAVATHNCIIQLLQPKGNNKHAIFMVTESEAIEYSYERNTTDPRIAHSLNIQWDRYGNVLESATVVYPRSMADTSLPAETQLAQNKTLIQYTKNQYTEDVITEGDVITEDVYRLRLPAEVETFELKGVAKADADGYYAPSDFTDILSDANSETASYHEIDKAPSPGKAQKRLIEHVRTTYYNEDLLDALPLHQLASHGLSFESYQLAYTPELITDIFGTKVNVALMEEGQFTHSEGDENWWIRSGTLQYRAPGETLTDTKNRFYSPISYTDPYGAITKVKYYGDYFLFVEQTEDALGNQVHVDAFNFRTLSPQRMRDINNNISKVLVDELGLVKATAILGKGNEADDLVGLTEWTDASEQSEMASFFNTTLSTDLEAQGKALLQHATARFVYDLDAYMSQGKPVVVAAIQREEHFQKNNDSPIQLSFEYSNGLGGIAMKKVQAEPGLAKQAIVDSDHTITINEIDTSALIPQQLRWIGNGRTVLNNKGNVVKQYEPYFSVTHHYEDAKELVETGEPIIFYYDALGRLTKTLYPDATFSKVEFNAWKQASFDANDTILESEWYINRTNRLMDAELMADGKDPEREKLAADKAAQHANTSTVFHFDTLARPILSVEHNKNGATDELYNTTTKLDPEGNLLSVTDARHNTVMQYKYDMLGNQVYQNSMDAGQRWQLVNILGAPLRSWDERDHEFQYFYDVAHRPTYSKVLHGDGTVPLDNIFNKTVYGESLLAEERTDTKRRNEAALQAKNVLGKIIKNYDTGGLVDTPEYDFKGHPPATTRKLFAKYKEVANWIDANLEVDLESDDYTIRTETDALGRVTKQVTPDKTIVTSFYNEAGLLTSAKVDHFDAQANTHQGEEEYIKKIAYNEKGQRSTITYGNEVSTQFHYDKETFRIKRLVSKRRSGDPLQDWSYTYDPVGNVTHIEDKNTPVAFFDNQKITGSSEYTYDALYRLVKATGRENDAALNFGDCDNWNDQPFMHAINSGDPMAMRNYTQRYQYDAVGNILEMKHLAAGGNWTRKYDYETVNNRLRSTQIGDNGNPINYTKYQHHAKHGFMEELPHLEQVSWNFKEEVVLTTRQRCTDNNIPVITYYQYDSSGQRLRKITENQASGGALPSKKDERIYVSGYECYKKHSDANAGLVRISLNLLDEGHRFAIIETRNAIDDGTEKQLVRYQLHNHVDSSALELDHAARIISYEVYHPFGTTAYQANNATIKAAAKRYRYTGMERDEETGLGYHSARYYLPWLGRWLSTDPIGIEDGLNLYGYVSGNPIRLSDLFGTNGRDAWDVFFGILKMAGGGAEILAGGTIIATGLASSGVGVGIAIGTGGVVVGAHGIDTLQAGFRQTFGIATRDDGEVDTFTSELLQSQGVERSNANLFDAGIGIVGTLGGGVAFSSASSAGSNLRVFGNTGTLLRRGYSSSSQMEYGIGRIFWNNRPYSSVGAQYQRLGGMGGRELHHWAIRNSTRRLGGARQSGLNLLEVPTNLHGWIHTPSTRYLTLREALFRGGVVVELVGTGYHSSSAMRGIMEGLAEDDMGERISQPPMSMTMNVPYTPEVSLAQPEMSVYVCTPETCTPEVSQPAVTPTSPSANPADYSTYAEYAAAQSSYQSISEEYLMWQWESVHGEFSHAAY